MTIVNIGLGSRLSKSLPSSSSGGGGSIYAARVTRVILDENTHPELFNKLGNWDSLGVIFYDDIKNPTPKFIEENTAYPIYPHIKYFPLINEVVYIISLPSNSLYDDGSETKKYYFNPINIWNNPHNNAIPDNIFGTDLKEVKLGDYFKERENVRGLRSYEGDLIFEGRWGNSIRFGSTSKNNEWSESGENGDPITILRNGQSPNIKGDNWVPINEIINEDLSGLYLTSYQKIPIKLSSEVYNSYDNAPIKANQYNKPQNILTSDRIIINSKKDHILLSSNKSVNINTQESVNIDSKSGFIVDTPKIYLGSKKANEALMLGNKTVDLLEKILNEVIGVTEQLSSLTSLPEGVPFAPLNIQATFTNNKLKVYKNQLKTLLSKRNYTI
jgi:hypothetical protein